MFVDDPRLPCYSRPELWLSEKISDGVAAKQLCQSCPLMGQCLTSALATEELMGTTLRGIHGGLTEQERIDRKAGSPW